MSHVLFSLQEVKPVYRGRIHRMALYFSILMGLILYVVSDSGLKKVAVGIYFASQIILYGVSSTYHITIWKSVSALSTMQKFDRSSIFILISGTQTALMLLLGPLEKSWPFQFLLATWTIAVFGFFKTFIWTNAPEVVSVGTYIVHGASVVAIMPFFFNYIDSFTFCLFVLGGIFYISGGIIFGIEKPDPYPLIFGFHEVFHALTILGNTCFMIPVIRAVLFK